MQYFGLEGSGSPKVRCLGGSELCQIAVHRKQEPSMKLLGRKGTVAVLVHKRSFYRQV